MLLRSFPIGRGLEEESENEEGDEEPSCSSRDERVTLHRKPGKSHLHISFNSLTPFRVKELE
jgi:hypothetical protein